ncbi:DUF2634 domain-containing protein [Caldanaerobacter subterraneus]|uniref:DUF2634 domain-containing protein n=1 Tax=Caldanaerobacter subterraneus TaxID=911092 RepID=A0A7Y2LAD2_9THEO|nr:DUF2634 domain-containing protein [Caldanaerobacter subterraneus]NNG67351.1 DUF2634 domain-containing protein [Caldanaerobacter subterraneus]
MESIFPFIEDTEVTETTSTTDIPKEYAWDFSANDFKLVNGKVQVVEGLEAIKIKVYKALMTQRYRYPIYSWDYGSEFEQLIGKDYSKELVEAEAKRFVEEALKEYFDRGWITGIKDFETSFLGDELSVGFTIETPYGEANISV